MVLGRTEATGSWLGAGLGLGIVAAIVLLHAAANYVSEKHRRATHRAVAAVVDFVRGTTLHRLVSVQDYPESEISPYFRINGYPPISAYPQAKGGDDTYERLLAGGFADYRLEVAGLVEHPLSLSLDDLRAMPRQEQTTLHHCIQGWTSIGRWGGVPVREILDRCRPLPGAKYLVFHSFGMHEKSGQAVLRVRATGDRPTIRRRSWPTSSTARPCPSSTARRCGCGSRRSSASRWSSSSGRSRSSTTTARSATAWAESARTSSSSTWAPRSEAASGEGSRPMGVAQTQQSLDQAPGCCRSRRCPTRPGAAGGGLAPLAGPSPTAGADRSPDPLTAPRLALGSGKQSRSDCDSDSRPLSSGRSGSGRRTLDCRTIRRRDTVLRSGRGRSPPPTTDRRPDRVSL